MSRGSCKVRLENVESYWQKIKDCHEQMTESESFDTNHEYCTSDFFDYAEEIYLQRKGEFEEFLICLETGSSTREIDRENNPSRSVCDQQVRLPIAELPKFSGDFRDWETFRDLMRSIIVDRNDISDVTKLQYLKGALSGEAADLIRTISVTEQNFMLAWQSLKDYYENTRRSISAHLASLLDLKPMKNESASELRRIHAGAINLLLALEALQRPVGHWDDLIVIITERRLDPQTRRAWEIKLEESTTPPDYEMLKNFLKTKIMSLDNIESCKLEPSSLSHSPGARNRVPFRRKVLHDRRGFPITENCHITGRTLSREPLCVLCNRNHWLAYCEMFRAKTTEQRKTFVESKELCLNCLGNHVLRNCLSKKRCQICHKRHHTLIHIQLNNSGLTDGGEKRDGENSSKPSSLLDASTSANVHLNNEVRSKSDFVLLSTVWVNVQGPGGKVVPARALLDQCAQSSFITESLCQRLKLHKQSISVTVSGLGGKQHVACRAASSITIKPRFPSSFSCKTEVLVVPRVTSYTPGTRYGVNDWSHLKDLVLADPNFAQNAPIELLLGAAVHARVVEGDIIKGKPNQPIATATALGWIISGETNFDYSQSTPTPTVLHSSEMSVDSLLQRFWLQEEINAYTGGASRSSFKLLIRIVHRSVPKVCGTTWTLFSTAK
ncbi:uncharacterized protein LOC124172514 isoform X1 [Ischnura elegans]|uniref:uncharacterized protein LOC124172514 isoform X1 n=1 Tax=Ischnura elegans TaxID=197161 RepID=UPI001ED8AEC2|nr:uncharacterized protein LOC124172514 isoform X1 [Ischnura elegans]